MRVKHKVLPYEPQGYLLNEYQAFKAMAAGNASPEQQKLVMSVMLYKISAVDDLAYRPNQRDTDFALGKQFVGQQINALVNADYQALRAKFKLDGE